MFRVQGKPQCLTSGDFHAKILPQWLISSYQRGIEECGVDPEKQLGACVSGLSAHRDHTPVPLFTEEGKVGSNGKRSTH